MAVKPAIVASLFSLVAWHSAANTIQTSTQLAELLEQISQACSKQSGATAGMCTSMCKSGATNVATKPNTTSNNGSLLSTVMMCAGQAQRVLPNSELVTSLQKVQSDVMTLRAKITFDGEGAPSADAPTQAASKAPATAMPKVDTNIWNADGSLNSQKLMGVVKSLRNYCGDGVFGNICRSAVNNQTKNSQLTTVLDAYDSYEEGNQKQYDNLKMQATNYGYTAHLIESSLTKEAKASPSYKVFSDFVTSVRDGKWPPAMVQPALDLDDLIPQAEPMDVVREILSYDAVGKLTFDQATAGLKALPEYQTVVSEAAKSRYTVAQLTQAIDNLVEKKSSFPSSTEWQKKLDEVGILGRRKALIEAVNETCNDNYLQKHNRDLDWRVQPKGMTFGYNEPIPLTQMVSAAHLHRLCFYQLYSSQPNAFTELKSKQQVDDFEGRYVSRAPIDRSKAYNSMTGPNRQIDDRNWLPKWFEFKQGKTAEFAKADQQQQKAQREREKQNAIVQQQQARDALTQQIVQAAADAADFMDIDFNAAVDDTFYTTRTQNGLTGITGDKLEAKKQRIQGVLEILIIQTRYRAQIADTATRYLDSQWMQDAFTQQYVNLQNNQKRRSRRNTVTTPESIAATISVAERVGVTPIDTVACKQANTLLTAMATDLSAVRGRDVYPLSTLLNQCKRLTPSAIRTPDFKRLNDGLATADVLKSNPQFKVAVDTMYKLNRAQVWRAHEALLDPQDNQFNGFNFEVDKLVNTKLQADAVALYTRWAGQSPTVLAKRHDDNVGAIAQAGNTLLQQTKGQPLPTEFTFTDEEAYVILNYVNQQKYRCRLRGISPDGLIADKAQFLGNLHTCGFRSRDANFKNFTVAYQQAYAQQQ